MTSWLEDDLVEGRIRLDMTGCIAGEVAYATQVVVR
jgi:hypothetical protein